MSNNNKYDTETFLTALISCATLGIESEKESFVEYMDCFLLLPVFLIFFIILCTNYNKSVTSRR